MVRIVALAGPTPSRLLGSEWPLDRTPTQWIVGAGEPVERSILRGSSDIEPRLLLAGPVTTLRAVPLRTAEPLPDGRPMLGALLAVRGGPEPFTESDRAIIDAYSSLVRVALVRDELHRETRRLYAEAKEAAAGMSGFLDLVIHELRSPLTVIAGYVDLLQQDPAAAAAWRKPLAIMAEKLDEMQTLVRELVLTAQLASGSFPKRCTTFDLRDAVSRAADRARPRAEQLAATLRPLLPEGAVLVSCDTFHVDHVLDNLINNALAHGGRRPQIDIGVTPDRGRATVVVTDNGPGISPEFHERVFERFFRIDPVPGQPGSGLGLHISRQLAADCGGTLEIESIEPDRGTRFVLRLPVARPGAGEPSADGGRAAHTSDRPSPSGGRAPASRSPQRRASR